MNRRIGGCCNQLLLEVRWTALSPFSISYHSQAGSTTVRSYQIWINQETDDREDSLKLVNDDSLLEVAGRLIIELGALQDERWVRSWVG